MNEQKKIDYKKSLIKEMFSEMKNRGYQSTNKKDIMSFMQYNNEGREIYGVGFGLSLGFSSLGIAYFNTFGIVFLILGIFLMVISMKGIYKIRTQESKLVELLK